jgi:NADP-dependent 3-hydroxy acid dehydrogenase YdfG
VTGASSGLGRHFAKTLASHGARVVVAARRQDKLQELLQEMQHDGAKQSDLCAVRMDVCDSASIKAAVAEVRLLL